MSPSLPIASPPPRLRSHAWELDLSGSLHGAGGSGGPLIVRQQGSSPSAPGSSPAPACDSNMTAYVDLGSGLPDGEGSTLLPFSTRSMDQDSGLLYYGFRYYAPELGRFISRDPKNEIGRRLATERKSFHEMSVESGDDYPTHRFSVSHRDLAIILRRQWQHQVMNKPEIITLAQRLWTIAKIQFVDSTHLLRQLAPLATPQSGAVVSYFSYLPEHDANIYGVRFMGLESVAIENSELVPGCYVLDHGFVAFASLDSGEVFVVELATAEVYLLQTEKYESTDTISPGWNETRTDFLPDIPITPENIKATASVSFATLAEFLVASVTDHRK